MSDPTCLSMLERVQQSRESESWGPFMEIYDPLLRKWLGGQGVRDSDADDVVQEVMRVVLEEIPRFKHNGRPGAFRRWMRMIMANRLRSLWRSQKHSGKALGGSQYIEISQQLEDPNSRLSLEWDARHDKHVCKQLLAIANGQFQGTTIEAFRKVALEGQLVSEVAGELGISDNAVRIAQHRVLRSLRELGKGLLDLPDSEASVRERME